MGKRDHEWEVVFDKYSLASKLENQETVEVSTAQIKQQGFEPRLLAKIDHSKDQPTIFKTLKLGILPVSVDKYVIGHFNMFKAVQEQASNSTPAVFLDPSKFDTLVSAEITSESAMLNLLAAQDIFSKLFKGPFSQTISGRRRTPDFKFFIEVKDQKREIRVNRAQIEIDGGFESSSEVLLIEAKNREIADFNIRQIYYPFRTYLSVTDKKLRNLVISRTGSNLVFREYEFADPMDFSTACEVSRVEIGFAVERQVSRRVDLMPLAEKAISQPGVPLATFPQANSFLRVIEVTRMLLEEPRSVADLVFVFEFDERQARYYLDAACYLGLAQSPNDRGNYAHWKPTRLAATVFQLTGNERIRKFAEIVLGNSPFALAFKAFGNSPQAVGVQEIEEIVKRDLEFQVLSEKTRLRRSSTIKKWLVWLFENTVE